VLALLGAPVSRPITLPEPWASLARELGGVSFLALCLGVGVRTVHRWAHGGRTTTLQREAAAARLRRRGLESPW
jgi:hypothetical protein